MRLQYASTLPQDFLRGDGGVMASDSTMREKRFSLSPGERIGVRANIRTHLLLVGAALFCCAALATHAQVQSLTLAIQVNSPYGIGEPWATIRDGLQRLEFVESMSQQPDHKASTGE